MLAARVERLVIGFVERRVRLKALDEIGIRQREAADRCDICLPRIEVDRNIRSRSPSRPGRRWLRLRAGRLRR
jgi:hypothetical protein